MVKSYACAGILLFAIGLFPLMAQDNTVAKEMAIKIADRIIASTVYEFKDVKTGKVYTSLDNVALNPDIRVNSKYLNWHYTNGVTNMALMELGDKIQNRKYEDYVLKNMKFIFDKTNQSYFHRLYDKTFREGGWRAVPRLTWHMIYRNKRLDDNGPMGATIDFLVSPYKHQDSLLASSSSLGFSEMSSNLSFTCSFSVPFGIRNSSPRFTIITSVPLGRFISFSVSASSSISCVIVISLRSVSISSGSSTPKSFPVFSSGLDRCNRRATKETVVPCTTSETIVMKNTTLKIIFDPSTPATTG